jgi:hypothetical protein
VERGILLALVWSMAVCDTVVKPTPRDQLMDEHPPIPTRATTHTMVVERGIVSIG